MLKRLKVFSRHVNLLIGIVYCIPLTVLKEHFDTFKLLSSSYWTELFTCVHAALLCF